jgi:antirestriction protein ArdC
VHFFKHAERFLIFTNTFFASLKDRRLKGKNESLIEISAAIYCHKLSLNNKALKSENNEFSLLHEPGCVK